MKLSPRSISMFCRGRSYCCEEVYAGGIVNPPDRGRGDKGKNLIGQWYWSDRENSSDMTFEKDGTFSSEVHIGKFTTNFKGKWRVKGDTPFYKYTSDSSDMIVAGTRVQDALLAVTPDHLTIRSQNSGVRIYHRIR